MREQPLGAFSVCNLGAINLSRFYDEAAHDVAWDELKTTVRYSTRFLDNVIDTTPYFFQENKDVQLSERRVGLGTMGIAELMLKLGVRYGSDESVELIDDIYKTIAAVAYETSSDLAVEKSAFPQFDAEKFLESGFMQAMPACYTRQGAGGWHSQCHLVDASANRHDWHHGQYVDGRRAVLLLGLLPQEPPWDCMKNKCLS